MLLALMLGLAIAAPSAKEDARKVLRRVGCQGCHDHTVSVQHTDALEQFDLADPKWSDGMTDRQLPILLERMANGDPADRKIVKNFIDAELRARHR